MGHENIPVYILFAALHESGVMMVEDILTMQVSDDASCVGGTTVQWRGLHPSFKLMDALPRSVRSQLKVFVCRVHEGK